jgi:5-bromo-4-chloroindolyl phosphate hydrolysis protein
MVELTPKAYERVRADPRHFFVLRGHELAEVETVVESHEQYVVVEKRAKAGKLAEASDPRC